MNEQKITLELDINSVNVIVAGLGKLPMESALPVFNMINEQAQAQLKTLTQSEPVPATVN